MKILVMTDLEGVAGVSVDRQLGGIDNPFYRKAREFLAEEIHAALCGAKEAGADEFVVCDGHGSGYDMMLDFERILPEARFISGTSGGFSYIDLQDEGFAAAFIVGQHARRGARGSLEHTGSNLICQGVWLNDREVGEAGMHAAVFGEMGIPLALVTGDEEVVKEVDAFGCGTVGVAVKKGLMRQRCITLHPVEARRRIREGAIRAVRALAGIRPWKLPPPYRLTIKYGSTSVAEKYAPLGQVENPLFPFIARVDADTVAVSGRSWCEVFRRLELMNRVV